MKNLLLLIFLLTSFVVRAQKPYHDGQTLFWPKSVPVKLIVETPSGDKYELKSEQNDSFYLDTEGLNFIRSKWLVDSTGNYKQPKREIVFPIYADSKPPKTTYQTIASTSYIYKGKKYYSDDLFVKLTSIDTGSGVDKIYYSIDSSAYVLYDSAIKIPTDHDVVLRYFAIDKVGNIENHSSSSYAYDASLLKFAVDKQSPITSITSDSIVGPFDKIVLTSIDDKTGVSSIAYSIDNSNYVTYDTPILVSTLSNGYHKLSYFAVDWINNKEQVKTFDVFVDKIKPSFDLIEELAENDNRYLTIKTTDNKAGVCSIKFKKNEGVFQNYASPIKIDTRKDIIIIVITDCVGNIYTRKVQYFTQ